jgi:hypothetical protein
MGRNTISCQDFPRMLLVALIRLSTGYLKTHLFLELEIKFSFTVHSNYVVCLYPDTLYNFKIITIETKYDFLDKIWIARLIWR